LISIENHVTTVSLTHFGIAMLQAMSDSTRWPASLSEALPRDTFVTHSLVHTQIYYCSNMSDLAKLYQLIQSEMCRFSSLSIYTPSFWIRTVSVFLNKRTQHIRKVLWDGTRKSQVLMQSARYISVDRRFELKTHNHRKSVIN